MIAAARLTAISLIIMGAVLFLAAGTLAWPQAWIFLAEFGAGNLAVSAWLARHDPALLAARVSGPVHPDQRSWDRLFLPLAMIAFLAWLALCGIDARRLALSAVPIPLQICGAALIALCLLSAFAIFRVNTYAAPQVRMQADRGQRVITNGPYRIVRHPMYAGALLFFAGAPLLLGSYWGLLFLPIGALGVGIRSVGEERMLRRELAGYQEYAARVRYRLVPKVW